MAKKTVFEVKKVSRSFWILLTINILFIIFLFLTYSKLPPLIPLFYGAASGGLQVASKQGIFLPSVITVIAILVNLIFSTLTSDQFLKRIFIGSLWFLSFLSMYTTVRILFLVGNI